MCKCYTKGVIALVAAIGATGALAGSLAGGTIHFSGVVLASGYRVMAAPRAAGTIDGLRMGATASNDQIVVDFSAPVARPVPVVVSVAARTRASPTWQHVGAADNDIRVRAQYGGFKANVLAGANGTLMLSNPRTAQPALAVLTVAYE